jgi:hypothetical protein
MMIEASDFMEMSVLIEASLFIELSAMSAISAWGRGADRAWLAATSAVSTTAERPNIDMLRLLLPYAARPLSFLFWRK